MPLAFGPVRTGMFVVPGKNNNKFIYWNKHTLSPIQHAGPNRTGDNALIFSTYMLLLTGAKTGNAILFLLNNLKRSFK